MRNPGFEPQGSNRAARQRLGRLLGLAALVSLSLLAWLAAPAQAATDVLHAAPAAAGTGDCSSSANACSIATAITTANAEPVADSVQIKLASGNYPLSSPSPTALVITFAGPSLTLEPESGTPVLDGTSTVRVLSVGATSNVTIQGLEIKSGKTAGLGGGIENSGTLTVKNSTFSGNSAGNGGGIASNAAGTLAVDNSTFSKNTTTGVGGGAIIVLGKATVKSSAIIANTAPINGGGINVQPVGTLTISSSTIAGNTSGGIGGAFANLGTLNVETSTIAGNSGSGGSAIATGNANVTFAADIIAAQTSGAACNPANTAIVDGGYNLDSDGTCISPTTPATGSHNGTTAYGSSTYAAVLDAYLADAPANNGGPTQTFALQVNPTPATTLADPAFETVPPSFNLPAPVDGLSAACSLSDQRGFTPAAGANCDIGSYLLQSTKTAITASTAKVKQNVSMTYTATITPAADGGTVSFNDGAGNPATTHCAAQPVSNGKASCTVSYPNMGAYSVNATYSGNISYVGSATTASTQTEVIDGIPPTAPKKLKGRVRHHNKLKLSWGASTDNVGVTGYQILHKGKVIKSTKAKVRKASIRLSGRGGAYAVRAIDAVGNISPLSKKVVVRRVHGQKKAYEIVKKKKK
jgi:hypothetical protein